MRAHWLESDHPATSPALPDPGPPSWPWLLTCEVGMRTTLPPGKEDHMNTHSQGPAGRKCSHAPSHGPACAAQDGDRVGTRDHFTDGLSAASVDTVNSACTRYLHRTPGDLHGLPVWQLLLWPPPQIKNILQSHCAWGAGAQSKVLCCCGPSSATSPLIGDH